MSALGCKAYIAPAPADIGFLGAKMFPIGRNLALGDIRAFCWRFQ